MGRIVFLVLAGWASTALAQTVTMPQTVEAVRGRMFSIQVAYDGDDFRYVTASAELDVFREYTLDPKEVQLRGVAYADGMFRIIAVSTKVGEDGKAKLGPFQTCLVKVGSGVPVPPVVVVPPDPTVPPVVVPPQPLAGMRVLMAYESDTPVPKTVYDSMWDPELEAYLRAKCLKGPDGVTPEFRRFDEDDPLTHMSPAWKALRAALPAALPRYPEPNPNGYQVPHLAIGDPSGAVVHSGPIEPSKLLETLKKYGGQ